MKNVTYQQRLLKQRETIVKSLPLQEMIRGSLLKRYLECIRPGCQCHKSQKYRHGPYYFLSIRKKDKSFHVYVPLKKQQEIERWVKNYKEVWQGIEDISAINIRLIRLMSKKIKERRKKW